MVILNVRLTRFIVTRDKLFKKMMGLDRWLSIGSSVPTVLFTTIYNSSPRGSNVPFWTLLVPHTCDTQIHAGKVPIHIK